MVTTLYLIRHGETEDGEVKRYKGSIDVPLSLRGIGQIREASAFIVKDISTAGNARCLSYLKDIHDKGDSSAHPARKLTHVYCSDLGRAVKSAEIVAEPHGLTPIVVPELRERSFGIWEGMSFTEIRESYPKEFAAWADNPVRHTPPGGESTLALSERTVAAFENILESSQRDAGEYSRTPAVEPSPALCEAPNIAVVAHGGVNRVILCHIMGIPLENVFRIEQDHAAVNIIEFWDKYPVVKLLNGGPRG